MANLPGLDNPVDCEQWSEIVRLNDLKVEYPNPMPLAVHLLEGVEKFSSAVETLQIHIVGGDVGQAFTSAAFYQDGCKDQSRTR